ncbi:MAG: hypothetical protein PVF18_12050, partial [Anaerolineales bacterium]
MHQHRIIWKMLKLAAVLSLLIPISVIAAPSQDVQAQDAGEPIQGVIEPEHTRIPVYTEPPTFTEEKLAEAQAAPPEIKLSGPSVPMVSDDVGFLGAETVVPFGTLAAQEQLAADSDFEIFRSTDLRDFFTPPRLRGFNEPSLDAHNDSIFYTGNKYAALSTDRGQSWGFMNPLDFPSVNSGFCCDQVVIYDPGNDIMIWLLQYYEDGTTNTDRIAVAHGDELTPDLAWTDWTYYDFNPQHIGYPTDRWFDYPRVAVSDNFLYVTSAVADTNSPHYRKGSATWRVPLSQLAAGGAVDYSGYKRDESFLMPTLGPVDRMYFGTHIDNSSLRLFTWLDGSSSWSTTTLTHDAYPPSDRGNFDCPTTEPGGSPTINICAHSDDRILGGWASSNIIGFMWNAANGSVGQTSFPWPYVEVVRYNESTREKIDQPRIWSNSVAWIYPGVAPNFNGHIAGPIFSVSGPSNLYPQLNLFIWDDYTPDPNTNGWEVYFVRGSTNAHTSPPPPLGTDTGDRWGDYVTSRQYRAYPNTWISGGFTMQGGSSHNDVHPQFMWFGRERDAPPVNTCNDDFDCPLPIGADMNLPSNTAYATTAVDDPIIPDSCASSASVYPRQSRSVWYKFSPIETGRYTV